MSEPRRNGSIAHWETKWLLLHPALWGIVAYLAMTMLIHVHVTGDTPEYAGAVLERLRTGKDVPSFWDPGHLLWRPLGYALYAVRLGSWTTVASSATTASISRVFIDLSLLAGAACAILLPIWLRQIGVSRWGAIVATLVLLSSNAFLDYYAGGTAYVPGLSFVILGLVLLSEGSGSGLKSAGAGVSLAIAVLLWLPFVLALPGALLAPILLGGWRPAHMRSVVVAASTCAGAGMLAYLTVALHLGIHSLREFTAWLSGASHGVTSINGLPRAIVGFSRSFINIGGAGSALKRFMLQDPLNPVSVTDLLQLGLWKMALFYLMLLLLALVMWRSSRTKALAFCGVSALPVLAFAIAWQGGDTERYLPLYPAFMLAIGACITSSNKWAAGRVVAEMFLVIAILVNTFAHSRIAFAAEERRIVLRAGSFNHTMLPASSIVVMPTMTDRTIAYFRSGAQDTSKIQGNFHFYPLIQQGADNSSRWRQDFSARTLEVWNAGGRVWLSTRVLRQKPQTDWGWAEGEDRDVSWTDFRTLFTTLELGNAIGGSDGFVELRDSSKNRAILEGIARTGSPLVSN